MDVQIKDFLQQYLDRHNLGWQGREKALEVELSSELAQLLAWQESPRVLWTWDLDTALDNPQAWLFAPKSQGLERLLGTINGFITCCHFPSSDRGPFRPHFLWLFHLCYQARQSWEEILPVVVDMVDGSISGQLEHLLDLDGRPGTPLPREKRRLSFRRAYWQGCNYVKQYLRERSKPWAQRAREDLKQRLDDLETYFAELGEEGEKQTRLEEESLRFSPQVLVSLRGGALIYWKNAPRPSALAACEFPAPPSQRGEGPADAPG
ncbi:MAG: hypothetical protein GX980_03875 [Firmicutes bacterium]|nr:hypothetical protein [Bacillota bacterium]